MAEKKARPAVTVSQDGVDFVVTYGERMLLYRMTWEDVLELVRTQGRDMAPLVRKAIGRKPKRKRDE